MANVRNGNTYYIDSASVSLNEPSIRVRSVLLTATNATNTLVLGDDNSTASYPTKLALVGTSGVSLLFDYSSNPIYFPNGIRVTTVTACTATLILEGQGV